MHVCRYMNDVEPEMKPVIERQDVNSDRRRRGRRQRDW